MWVQREVLVKTWFAGILHIVEARESVPGSLSFLPPKGVKIPAHAFKKISQKNLQRNKQSTIYLYHANYQNFDCTHGI